MYTVGLENTGCAVELVIVKSTPSAYLLMDDEGREFWLAKSAFDEYGELTERGMRMYEDKLMEVE